MANLILGHTTDSTIKTWFRANASWPYAHLELQDENGLQVGSQVIQTKEASFYCSVYEWKGLSPNTAYRVKLWFSQEANAGLTDRIRLGYCDAKFRTFVKSDNKDDFNFILGSCNLHSLGLLNNPDKVWLEISRIAKVNQARFMIHCGDQIYADVPYPFPPASLQHYREKYMDAWEDCIPAKKFLTELPNYMILDDHEIINNYDTSMKGMFFDAKGLSRVAMQVYWEFQHSHNPDSRSGAYHYHYTFNYGAVQFFVMDTRYYRDSNAAEPILIDPLQEKDLLEWLVQFKDDLKFIVTSVPFVGQVKSPNKDKWCDTAFDVQRGRILKEIITQNVQHVVFLTGDMHHSYHGELQIKDGEKNTVVHELMSSPINQITPDTLLANEYDTSSHWRTLPNGLQIQSAIDPNSFYGNHSNVMAISAGFKNGTPKVGYKIFRTTEKQDGPTGSFLP